MVQLRSITTIAIGLATIGLYSIAALHAHAAQSDLFRFASWNMNTFWHIPGEPLHQAISGARTIVRTEAEITYLKQAAKNIDADIIALQSVGSLKAVRRIFPAHDYHAVFSRQLAHRFYRDETILTDPTKRMGYTALVIRRLRADGSRNNIRIRSKKLIALSHRAKPSYATHKHHAAGLNQRPTVAALAVKLAIHGQIVWLINVDLAPGCESAPGQDLTSPACRDLKAQYARLRQWLMSRKRHAKIILTGSLRRSPAPADNGVSRDFLWRNLLSITEVPRRSDARPQWLEPNRTSVEKKPHFPTIHEPSRDPHQRLAEKLGYKKPRSNEYRGVTDLINSAFTSFWLGVTAPRPDTAMAETASIEIQKPQIPKPVKPPSETYRYTPRPVVDRNIIRFPDGYMPGHCTTGAPRSAELTHDYMLISRAMDDDRSIADFGTQPINSGLEDQDSNAIAGQQNCANYVDIRFPRPEPRW